MLVEDMPRNKFLFGFEYHMFCVLHPFVNHLLTFLRIEVRASFLTSKFERVAAETPFQGNEIARQSILRCEQLTQRF
jgi:hypothetical protein